MIHRPRAIEKTPGCLIDLLNIAADFIGGRRLLFYRCRDLRESVGDDLHGAGNFAQPLAQTGY